MGLKALKDKFCAELSWKRVDRGGMNAYYENSLNGDRKAVRQTETVRNGILLGGYSPIDMNWLSEAKGRAIIKNAPNSRIVEHEDLHTLRVSTEPPRNIRSAVQIAPKELD